MAEAAQTAAQFDKAGVGVSLTVTPAWCYGAETMDMHPYMPKAIWGFNGTERPGAVYLAAVLAAHNQKGLPAFGIYGRDVQDAGDTSIPADVQEKLLRFARAGLAVATMRGQSYLAMGGVSMWIAGVMQGLMWRAVNEDGTLTYSFVESLEAMYPFYFVRFLGGALFLCGMLVMAYNVVKTVSGARPVDAPVPQTA